MKNSGAASSTPKILTHEQVDVWLNAERAAGRTIGFTCGAFDILHAGHVQYLEEARKLCDRLLVAVNTDASIQRYKDPLRPVNPWEQRARVIAGLAAVDAVTSLDEERPLKLIERWKPDRYIKGGDYQADALRSGEAVLAYGGKVDVIPPAFFTSSTDIVDKIHALRLHSQPERAAAKSGPLVVLDRDGTLIRNIPFLHDPEKVELLPGVIEGMSKLAAAGFRLAIATNQQGIGLGYYTVADFIAVNQRMLQLLAPSGALISRIYFCPHSAADECSCRKPGAGMLRRAFEEFGVQPGECVFIGDTDADMEAARSAGCRAVRVGDGEGTPGAIRVSRFDDAADWIVNQREKRR
jgi:D-glycero-D-manno-heptose 1,7-bisphosphate phosphatase